VSSLDDRCPLDVDPPDASAALLPRLHCSPSVSTRPLTPASSRPTVPPRAGTRVGPLRRSPPRHVLRTAPRRAPSVTRVSASSSLRSTAPPHPEGPGFTGFPKGLAASTVLPPEHSPEGKHPGASRLLPPLHGPALPALRRTPRRASRPRRPSPASSSTPSSRPSTDRGPLPDVLPGCLAISRRLPAGDLPRRGTHTAFQRPSTAPRLPAALPGHPKVSLPHHRSAASSVTPSRRFPNPKARSAAVQSSGQPPAPSAPATTRR
jgi:hypothetical protein